MLEHRLELVSDSNTGIQIKFNYDPQTLQPGDLSDLADKLNEISTLTSEEVVRRDKILQIIAQQANISRIIDTTQNTSRSLDLITKLVTSIHRKNEFDQSLASLTTKLLNYSFENSKRHNMPIGDTTYNFLLKLFTNNDYGLFEEEMTRLLPFNQLQFLKTKVPNKQLPQPPLKVNSNSNPSSTSSPG